MLRDESPPPLAKTCEAIKHPTQSAVKFALYGTAIVEALSRLRSSFAY